MGQDLNVVEQCDEAIKAFFRARARYEGADYEELVKARFDGDAAFLATHGGRGLYYGQADSDVRLCLTGGTFYIGGGVMEYQDFRQLQDIAMEEFAASGLPLYEMLRKGAERHITSPSLAAQPA